MCNNSLHMGTFHFAAWSRSFSFAIVFPGLSFIILCSS